MWPLATVHGSSPGAGSSGDGGSPGHRFVLLFVVVLLLLLPLACGASGISLLSLWLEAGVPGLAFSGPGTLVGEAEQPGDVLDVVGRQLLQHIEVSYPLTEGDDDRSWSDARNGVANLRKVLDEGPQRLVRSLSHSMEHSLHIGVRV
jgi:hypothetical protein